MSLNFYPAAMEILVGMDEQMTVGTDGEVAVAPAGDIIKIRRIDGAPTIDIEISGCH